MAGRRARLATAGAPALLAASLTASPLASHPGGTDSQGCHNNRQTGEYHCHGNTPRTKPQPVPAGAYYPNCDAARAAGVAPLRRGQPGYRPGLDRDGDGIACEPRR